MATPARLLSALAAAAAASKPTFQLGACYDIYNWFSFVDYAAKLALEEGLLDDVLTTTNFSVDITSVGTRCNAAIASQVGLPLFLGFGSVDGRIHSSVREVPPVVAINGCTCSDVTKVLANQAAHLKVPMVSGSSTSPDLSNKDVYPYFARTIPPDDLQGRGLAKLVQHYGWTRVFGIHQAGEGYGAGIVEAFCTRVRTRSATCTVKTLPYLRSSDDPLFEQNYGRALLAARAIAAETPRIMLVAANYVDWIVHAFEAVGLVSDRHMWFVGESCCSIAALLRTADQLSAYQLASNSSLWRSPLWDQMPKLMQGMMCQLPKMVGSRASSARWSTFFGSLTKSKLMDSGYPPHAAWQDTWMDVATLEGFWLTHFDSMVTIFVAIAQLLSQGTPPSDIWGDGLMKAIASAYFEGLSGPVAFDPGTFDRLVPYSVFNLQAHITPVLVSVGEYDGLQDSLAIWGDVLFPDGSSSNIPLDAPLPCSPGTEYSVSEMQCVQCPAGKRSPTGGSVCSACIPGRYAAKAGLSECDVCHAGRYQVFYGESACAECAAGNYTGAIASAECLPCEAGTFMDSTGASICTKCVVGEYTGKRGQRSCTSCRSGKSGPELHATLHLVRVAGEDQWVPLEGAADPSNCGCLPGAFEFQGECRRCGVGMLCLGMGSPMLLRGFFATASAPDSVFQCFGDDFGRCSGGAPGSCAPGRLNTSVACVLCQAGWRAVAAGPCEPCHGTDFLPLVCTGVAALVMLVSLYKVVVADRVARHRASVMVAVTGSQMLTLLQQLGVFAAVALDWPFPFKNVLDAISIFTFNLDYLHLECVAPISPVANFGERMLLVVALLLALLLIHIFAVLRFHQGDFATHMPALINAVGTLFMAFFLSIVSSACAPFQCKKHPNGVWTVSAYPSVVCYGDADGAHEKLVIIGIVASAIPAAFLAVTTYATVKYASKMITGDTFFLQSYGFLFFRFKPAMHWYPLLFLTRNLFIALIPALGNTIMQLLFLHVILLPSALIIASTFPWVVHSANILDVCVSGCVLTLVHLFAIFVTDVNGRRLAELCCAVVGAAIGAMLLAVARAIWRRFLRAGKPFQFFLCHHKQGAGNFVRVLKMSLVTSSRVVRKVFLDSDDLKDLGNLFNCVRSDTDTLVVVCSREVLARPWCAGELATARLHRVPVLRVLLPDFQTPLDDFIDDYGNKVPDVRTLAQHGIDTGAVQDTLRWLKDQPSIIFAGYATTAAFQELVVKMLRSSIAQVGSPDPPSSTSSLDGTSSRAAVRMSGDIHDRHARGKTWILADLSNLETACAALCLQMYLAPLLPANLPCVLEEDAELPESAKQICLICSTGMFGSAHVVSSLLIAAMTKIGVLPVVSEPSFRVPTKDIFASLSAEVAAVLRSGGDGDTGISIVGLVEQVFLEIAVEVHPQDSEDVLRVRVQAVASRLSAGPRQLDAGCCSRGEASEVQRQDSDDLRGRVQAVARRFSAKPRQLDADCCVGGEAGKFKLSL